MDRQRAVDLVHGLVAIQSLSHREAEASAWLVGTMQSAGYDRAFVDAAGNAVGEIGAEDAPRTLVLLGHIDTVPGNIPVRIEASAEGDVLYGRGSVDAKGPLATFVAAAAGLTSAWAREHGLRIVVVGAVEEEAATSKGARFVAARLDGTHERVPDACVIGEPSHWHRVTLGYKGRLLLDLDARQPMAHTAGPDASVATVVVDLWNWVSAHAARVNEGRDKAFDQLSPSLRRLITSTTPEMIDAVDAQIAWRLPLGVDPSAMVAEMIQWAATHLSAQSPMRDAPAPAAGATPDSLHGSLTLTGAKTTIDFRFRGFEQPWRGDRQNPLVRSFLGAIRTIDSTAQPGFVLKTGTSDMNVVAPIWRCPIVAYGPGDSALDHTPNEHLSLDEYWRAVQVMERMIRTFVNS
jgi:LysW-gamma-L-lysine carboxypeptidase